MPSNMCLFSDIRKSHYNCVVKELQLRNSVFDRTKLNAKGKEAKTGAKQLMFVIKSVAYPNEIEDIINMSTKEKEKCKFFEPMHFASAQWTETTAPNPIINPDANVES